jgi:ADP-ribose pyrophosphatase YjhB (NUDIX family)
VLLFDRAGRICLLRCRDDEPINPATPGQLEYWSTPGGGLEPGETHDACALRELREELGIAPSQVRLCGPVASWQTTLRCRGTLTLVVERWIVARLAPTTLGRPAPLDLSGLTGDERRWIREARWWTVEETQACPLPIMTPPLDEMARAANGL